MESKQKIGGALQRAGVCGIGVLTFFLMALLSLAAFLFTSDMNMDNSVHENISFLQDRIWLNLLILAACLGLFWYLKPKLDRLPVKTLKRWMTLWVIGFGLLWVFSALSYPTHDSRMVTQAGEACANGDFSLLHSDYFKHFPFQLGYVFYSELMMRLIPVKDFYLHIEAANILFLAGTYLALVQFVTLVFQKERVTRLTIFLLALCLQPILFSTFLYGTIPGLCCAMWAVVHTVQYVKQGGWKHLLFGALLLAFAVSFKQNYLIVLVAVCIFLLLHLLRSHQWRHLLYIMLAVTMVLGMQNLITWQYEKRADVEFGKGIPIVSWAAMGLNEGYTAAGWYDVKYTVRNFDNLEQDNAKASQASVAEIKGRLQKFSQEPMYTVKFFSKKVLSQWNEPTYQSIWTNQVRGHYNNGPWGLARLVCGSGEAAVKGYMNFYQQLIFLCTAVALWQLIKKKELTMAILPLILLGGFLYHFLFEGKSQYIEPYFVMMVPLAAYGLHLATEWLEQGKVWLRRKHAVPVELHQEESNATPEKETV